VVVIGQDISKKLKKIRGDFLTLKYFSNVLKHLVLAQSIPKHILTMLHTPKEFWRFWMSYTLFLSGAAEKD
jgi:hypothetical protein